MLWYSKDCETILDKHQVSMKGFSGITGAVQRAWGMPPRVIAFRAAQELRLGIMRYARTWPHLERSIKRWWSDERIQQYTATKASHLSIIASDAPAALRLAIQHRWLIPEELYQLGQCLQNPQIDLLGVPV